MGEQATTKTPKKGGGLKFQEKYGNGAISTSQGYKTADCSVLKIPPKGHALHDADGNVAFDEHRVREIDRDGKFTGDVIAWTDVDRGEIYIVEGRGNVLDVAEVNRRRRERGDAEIEVHFKLLDVDLDRAAEHVRLRNFHRKRPNLAHYAREILALHKLGKPWARIAEILHLGEDESNEKWMRSVAALAHCIEDVGAAVEAGKISLAKAKKFGGKAIDGSERLPVEEQREALAEMLGGKPVADKKAPPKVVSPASVERVRAALSNGAVAKITDPGDKVAAEVAARVVARLCGDKRALAEWPAVAEIVEEALADQRKKGKKATADEA